MEMYNFFLLIIILLLLTLPCSCDFHQGIETLSKRLNHERNQFWLLHFNSDIVKNFDVLADNKYIRLIEKEESIADILYGTN